MFKARYFKKIFLTTVITCLIVLTHCSIAEKRGQRIMLDISPFSYELYETILSNGFTKVELFTDSVAVSNFFYINAQINEKNAILFIDSGSTSTKINKRFYDKVKIEDDIYHNVVHDVVEFDSCEECVKYPLTSKNTELKLGDSIIPFFGIPVVDLDFHNSERKKVRFLEIDGIIGSDVLKLGSAIIDVIGMTLFFMQPPIDNTIDFDVIHHSIVNRGPSGFNFVSLNFDSGFITANAKINNELGNFIIDTGANRSAINKSALYKFNIEFAVQNLKVVGIHDTEEAIYTTEPISTEIGTTWFTTKPVFLNIENRTGNTTEAVDGIIGTDVLSYSVICFNNMLLYIINNN